MLYLVDGRSELYQWDTGRVAKVNVSCNQIHFSNPGCKEALVVDVVDGQLTIPDEMLQRGTDLLCWAYVGVSEDGYTKMEKAFKVRKRPKPADYVYTPSDQKTLEDLYANMETIVEEQVKETINTQGAVTKEDLATGNVDANIDGGEL